MEQYDLGSQYMLEYIGPIFRIKSSPYFLLCLFRRQNSLLCRPWLDGAVWSAVVSYIANKITKLFEKVEYKIA